jgi:hypothetical protein
MKTLKAALMVAAVVSLPVLLAARAAGGPAIEPGVGAQASTPAAGDRAKFVGTYSLVTTEVKDAKTGAWSRTPNFNSIGYITYSDTGHMGVHIMPKVRARFASNIPTPQEAQAALRGYTAYFGSFTVDSKEAVVTHHRVGQISPGAAPALRRYYDFVPDPRNPRGGFERLILTPVPANGGKDQATNRLIWERMPAAPLSAEAKKFVGFYKLLYTDSYRMKDGKEVFHGDKNEARAGTSYIIYTPTGHMMVHLMPNSGRKPYAGAQPTPEESLAAYRSYSGYFGRFAPYENHTPRFVVHSQLGSLNPGGYSDQWRFYEFTGNVLRLGGPPSLNENGELAGGHLYWERLPATR